MHRGLAAGAAILRIVRRRLQPGRRTNPAFAAVDRRIEQFRQGRPDRLHLGTVGFRFRSSARLLREVWILRHPRNMG
jgi:hypothetical protein